MIVMFLLAWWELQVARQGCLVPLRKGGMWQSSQPASFSLAGLTLCPNWLERWLTTLNMLSTQVRIPVELSMPIHYITNTYMHHSGSKVNRDFSHYHMGRILLPRFFRRSCNLYTFLDERGSLVIGTINMYKIPNELSRYTNTSLDASTGPIPVWIGQIVSMFTIIQPSMPVMRRLLYTEICCVNKCQIFIEFTIFFILFSFPIHVYCRLKNWPMDNQPGNSLLLNLCKLHAILF